MDLWHIWLCDCKYKPHTVNGHTILSLKKTKPNQTKPPNPHDQTKQTKFYLNSQTCCVQNLQHHYKLTLYKAHEVGEFS